MPDLEIVRDYLARYGIHRNQIPWDPEKGAWKYPLDHFGGPVAQGVVDGYCVDLCMVVPGLSVVEADSRYIWFTWSRDAMWDRLQEVFREYGAADERLAYMPCSGVLEGPQTRLGFVQVEPAGTSSPGFYSGYTQTGLRLMERGFIRRIREPNRGGPEAIPFSSQRCTVGDHWWLVGSRGDSLEVLQLEIQGSPLEPRVKENLLLNLGNYRSVA